MYHTWKLNTFMIHMILYIDLFLPNTSKNSSHHFLSACCVPGTFLNALWILVHFMFTKIWEVFNINNLSSFFFFLMRWEHGSRELLSQCHIDYKWVQWDLNLSSQPLVLIYIHPLSYSTKDERSVIKKHIYLCTAHLIFRSNNNTWKCFHKILSASAGLDRKKAMS